MQKLLFVYNPHAGKGTIKNKLSDIVDIFVKAGYEVTIHPTQAKGDAREKIKASGGKYDRIVCSGGDGTLNEVASGLLETGLRVPVGYIPTGSTNDFGKSVRIPKQALKAAKIAVGDTHYYSDLGSLNDECFVYVAAFGIFTDVSYQTRQEVKNVLGHSAYILEGMKRLNNIPVYDMKIQCDDQEVSGRYIYGMISNSESIGGFKNLTGKEVQLDDGKHEVILVREPATALQFQELLIAVVSGELNASSIDRFKASKVKITCDQAVPWTLDGEFGGEHKEMVVINYMQALDILVSEK